MTISAPSRSIEADVQHRLDKKTKPTGSLGRIEQLALQLALALDTPEPKLDSPQMVVFAADHGIAAHGVSANSLRVSPGDESGWTPRQCWVHVLEPESAKIRRIWPGRWHKASNHARFQRV